MCQSAWDKVGAQCILVSHLPFFIYKMRNFKIPLGLVELQAPRIRGLERHLVWLPASPVGGHAVLVCTSLMMRNSFPRKAGHSIFRQLCLKKSPLLWRLPRASITGPAFASWGQPHCPTWHSQTTICSRLQDKVPSPSLMWLDFKPIHPLGYPPLSWLPFVQRPLEMGHQNRVGLSPSLT